MEKIKKFLIKREVEMKKIILCLILIGFLRAFIDMPPGWRHKNTLVNANELVYALSAVAKGDTIWLLSEYSGSGLHFLYSENNGFDFSRPLQVLVDQQPVKTLFTHTYPKLVVDNENNLYIVYCTPASPYTVVVIKSPPPWQNWIKKFEYVLPSQPHYIGLICYPPNHLHLIYDFQNNSFPYLWDTHYRYSSDGGNTWLGPFLVPRDTEYTNISYPRIAVDVNENVYVLYHEWAQYYLQIKLRKKLPAGWSNSINFPFQSTGISEQQCVMKGDPSVPDVIHFIYN